MAESVTSSRARAPSPTSETWFIDQVLEELAAHRAGRLNHLCERLPAEGGEFHYAGLLGDEERCAITHVRDSDEAVTPIAAGDFHRAISVYARRAKSWDPEASPPPSVIIDGARRHFTPTHGRFLVGIIDAAPRAVLLAAIGTAFAVIHLDRRGEPAILHLGAPRSLRVLDLDRLLPFRQRAHAVDRDPEPLPAVRLPGATRLHHLRIVRGVPLAHASDPSIDAVIAGAFASVAIRASQPEKRAPGWRAQGKTKLLAFFEFLLQLGHRGCLDIGGRISEVHAFFVASFGEAAFRLSKKVLATVLRLLHRAGTCLVRKPSARTWTIRLAGLTDPRSALHRTLLRETATPFRFRTRGSPATAANSRPAQPEAGPVADAGTGRDPETNPTAASDASRSATTPTPIECLAGLCLALATQAKGQRDALEVRVREQADALALVTDELKSIKDEREGLHAELALRDQAAAEAVALAETSIARFCELESRARDSEGALRRLRAQLAAEEPRPIATAPEHEPPTSTLASDALAEERPEDSGAALPDHARAAGSLSELPLPPDPELPSAAATTTAPSSTTLVQRPRGPPS